MRESSVTEHKSINGIIVSELEKNVRRIDNYNLFSGGLFLRLVLNLLAPIIDNLIHDEFPAYHHYYIIYRCCVGYCFRMGDFQSCRKSWI